MSTNAPTSKPRQDEQGRFVTGKNSGPGNPFTRRIAALRKLVIDSVSEEDLRETVRRIVEAARKGDIAAAKVLLAYTIGKPTDAIDPDTLDVKEWQLLQQMPVAAPQLTEFLMQVPCDVVCELLRHVWPIMAAKHLQPLLIGLQEGAMPSTKPRPRGQKPGVRGQGSGVRGQGSELDAGRKASANGHKNGKAGRKASANSNKIGANGTAANGHKNGTASNGRPEKNKTRKKSETRTEHSRFSELEELVLKVNEDDPEVARCARPEAEE